MENKKKKKKLKKLIPILTIFIIIGAFFASYFIDAKIFYSKLRKYDDEYLLKVTYLIMDKDKIPNDADVVREVPKYVDDSLMSVNEMVPLEKKGDYLYLDLNNNVNDKLLENVNSYIFTLNDFGGNVIDGCEYDKKTNIAKIPIKYYEKRTEDSPIQLEVVSLMEKEEYENMEIKTRIKGIYTSNGSQKQNPNTLHTVISLDDLLINNLSKNDIELYINDYDIEMDSRLYSYDNHTKEIELSMNPIIINSISIKVNNLFISNVLAESHEVEYKDMNAILLKSKPSSFNSYKVSNLTSGSDFYYCGSASYSCSGGIFGSEYVSGNVFDYDYSYHDRVGDPDNPTYSSAGHLYVAFHYDTWQDYLNRGNTSTTKPKGSSNQYPYLIDLTKIGGNYINFTGAKKIKANSNSTTDEDSLLIPLICIAHSGAAAPVGDLDISVTKIATGDNYIVLRINTTLFHSQIGQTYIRLTWPKGYVKITKQYTTGTAHSSNLIFDLYKSSNDDCTSGTLTKVATTDPDATGSLANTGLKSNNTTFYLGVDDYISQGGKALLDTTKTYCIHERAVSGHNYTITDFQGQRFNTDHSPKAEYGSIKQNRDGVIYGKANLSKNTGANSSNNLYYYKDTYITNDESKGCLSITKTDGFNNISNVSFKLFSGTGCSDDNLVATKSTGNNGVVKFDELTPGQYSYKEVSDLTGLKVDKTCKSKTVTSSSTCDTATENNPPYYIGFYKKDEKGNAMPNISFKVKSGSDNNYVTVSNPVTGKYNGCYIYTGTNSTGSVVTTNASGYVCIAKIKASGSITYTALEQSSPAGYIFENGKIEGITPNTNVAGVNCTTANCALINHPSYIAFYKKNEKGEVIKNVKFKVHADNETQYITVAANKEDGCYVYSGKSATGSELLTDDNGRICIKKVPVPNTSATQSIKYTAVEIEAPAGYVFKNGTITGLTPGKIIQGDVCSGSNCNVLYNHPTVLNFYKVIEDEETKEGGAKFTLSYDDNGTTKYVKVKSERATADGLKGCYIYDSSTTTASQASELEALIKDSAHSDTLSYDVDAGEVCVVKIPVNKTYTATEKKPLNNHTYGASKTKTIIVNNDSTDRKAMDNGNKFINYRTEFEFTKTVADETDDAEIKTIVTSELKNIPFTIYSGTNPIYVVKTADGVYEYAVYDSSRNVYVYDHGKTSTNGTTTLNLNDERKIKVYHLPIGNYTIREEDCCCDSSCQSPSSNNCYGYYAPKYSEATKHLYEFTITECSSGSSSDSITGCTPGVVKKSFENIPTKVEFTKSDFYHYVDPSETVKFENEEERSAFDEITFKVYRIVNGVKEYVGFIHNANTGSCTTDASHSNYQYVANQNTPGLEYELHTCGGHIEITHLCRGQDWYIEEVSVSGKSVFILPETEEERTVKVELDCCNETSTPRPSETVQINDKPTRVVFEKRDSKYGHLIDDETTTFEVYRCAEGTECHPGDYDTVAEREAAGMTLVKFNARGVIQGDEEDPNTQVYRAVTNVDHISGTPVTGLHPYHGKLVFRYMESGYNYVLLETVSPKGYKLPTGRDAESTFTISTETVQVEEIDVPNKPTSILIKKYDDNGNLLEGAEFRVYETSTCGGPVKPKDKDKTLLTLKTIRDGIYENREVKDTDTLITCTDKPDYKCSDMVTTLTLDKYTDTFVDFDRSVNQNNQRVEITAGEILVQYLFYGKCYIIEEVKAPKGYSLPEDENDRFVEIEIKPESDVVDTGKDLVNKPTPFTFYKFDEYNNLIDGGEFKLQKLNQNKKYEDLTVTEEELNGKLYYKVDPTSTNKVIKTRNGEATVYYLEEGQYRIVETKAPEGMELPKKEINVAVFYVDEDGRVIGNSIITNKPKTEKITIKPTASAELIVNISTGIDRIKYGLIIGAIVVVLGGLIVFRLKALNKAKKD